MECAVVVPHYDVAFLDFRKPYILGPQDASLDVVQEGADSNHVVNNRGAFVYGRPKKELSCSEPVDLKRLFAGYRVDPYKGVLGNY